MKKGEIYSINNRVVKIETIHSSKKYVKVIPCYDSKWQLISIAPITKLKKLTKEQRQELILSRI